MYMHMYMYIPTRSMCTIYANIQMYSFFQYVGDVIKKWIRSISNTLE